MARSEMITALLDDYRIDPRRFQITWVSSAEPDRFVAAVKDMTATLGKLGPIASSATVA